jgi:hypothetical protein
MLSAFRSAPTILSSQFKHAALLALCVSLFLCAQACGKRKPPIPPRERVLQRVELSGFQRGNQVVLSWKMPARNAPKADLLNVSRIDIYRLVEPVSSPIQLSEEEFANRSTLIAAFNVTDADFGLQNISHRDELEFAGQGARLRYAIRFVNASGQRAGFSNVLLIEPTSAIASGPGELEARVSQTAISLSWQPPSANIDGSTPASIIGYNIYRSESEKVPAVLLNKTPVDSSSFEDSTFDFGKEYFYFVRAVSSGTAAGPVESSESNIVKVQPTDTFAPSPPSAITVAAAPGTISIFFAINPEADIAGYRVYRSLDSTLPNSEWTLLTPQLLTANTFQDSRVEPGKTYYYFVTAVDRAGNVSKPSELASETAP